MAATWQIYGPLKKVCWKLQVVGESMHIISLVNGFCKVPWFFVHARKAEIFCIIFHLSMITRKIKFQTRLILSFCLVATENVSDGEEVNCMSLIFSCS